MRQDANNATQQCLRAHALVRPFLASVIVRGGAVAAAVVGAGGPMQGHGRDGIVAHSAKHLEARGDHLGDGVHHGPARDPVGVGGVSLSVDR